MKRECSFKYSEAMFPIRQCQFEVGLEYERCIGNLVHVIDSLEVIIYD